MQIGDKYTIPFEVTDKIYNNFIESYRDRNPLHTDEAFARGKGFRSVVMHGNILGGFLSYFIGECLPSKDVIIHSQDIKYSLPVYLGDKLILNVELSEAFESVRAFIFRFNFQNDAGKKVARGSIQIGMLE